MKIFLSLLLIVTFYYPLKAQKNAAVKDSIYAQPEVDAEFPDGVKGFFKFIGQNMHYPVSAVRMRLTGKVTTSFVVETNGELSKITIVKGLSPDMDKEALRIVSLSPKWKPAMQSNKKVRASYTFPITFYLPELPDVKDGLDTIYAQADIPPQYTDGDELLTKFIDKNLRNPFSSMPHIEGSSVVTFVVEKNGDISNIDVLMSPVEAMKNEDIRLVKLLSGKFTPAKQKGVPVRAQYMVLIRF